MTEEEYNQQKDDISDQLEELQSKLVRDRSNNENDYNQKRNDIQKQIDLNNESIDIYQNLGLGVVSNTEELLNSDRDILASASSQLTSNLHQEYQETLESYRKVGRQLEQDIVDAKREYNRKDDQIQEDFSADRRKLESKLEDLEDDFNNSLDDGW